MPTTKKTDYYRVLGIKRNADDKQIRHAFRELARKYHPDLNPDSNRAEANFKAVNEAYEVLSDPDSRKKYDRYGDNWKHADQMGSPFGRGHAPHQSRGSNFEDLFQGGFGNQSAGFEDMFGNFGRRRSSEKRQPSKVETDVSVTLEEAYKILNLDINKNVTKEDVKKAHTKIQKKIHPDISPETSRLSTIVNEAKELILKTLN